MTILLGREQFFWHYARSTLPIRDITKKTEPHIEIGAENYLRPCIQPNVKGFCHSMEKYMFLCTTCKNREVDEGQYFGKRLIVGYIKKGICKNMDGRLAVIGDTYITPFDKELEYERLEFNRSRGMQRFGKEDVEKLLKLIHSHENIRIDCVKEILKKEREARRIGQNIPIDVECLGDECKFRDNLCLRRKLQ